VHGAGALWGPSHSQLQTARKDTGIEVLGGKDPAGWLRLSRLEVPRHGDVMGDAEKGLPGSGMCVFACVGEWVCALMWLHVCKS